MTVTETTSTNGGYKTFSEEHATLTSAISAVINELETHNIPLNQTQFVLTYDENNNKFAFVAICKRS